MEQKRDKHLHLMLTAYDRETLEKLAKRWHTTLAETIRRAISETFEALNK